MKSSINHIIALIVLVTTILSCNQDPSLQTYYVENELQPGFTSIDIPTSLLNIDETTLTAEQKEAYKSVDKLNMLAFVVNEENRAEYELELSKINNILKDPKYEELMRGGSPETGKFVIKTLGGEEDIDELILFGNATDKGFAVVRILGNNMNANKLMTLSSALQDADFNDTQLNQITDIFK